MEARPCTDSVFQLQDAQLMVEAKAFYRLYRFVLVRRSSWNFKSSNYVADSRRRSKLKFLPSKSKHQISIISQLIPTEQLLFLLWCKSSKTVIMPSGHSPQRNSGSTNTSRIAASSNRILKGADLASRPPHGKTSTKIEDVDVELLSDDESSSASDDEDVSNADSSSGSSTSTTERLHSRNNRDAKKYDRTPNPRQDQDPLPDPPSDDGSKSVDY